MVCLAALAVTSACGADGDRSLGTQQADATRIAPPDFGSRAPEVCGRATQPLSFAPKAVDMLLLFDRSGSMSQAFGNSSRIEVESQLLEEWLWAYHDRIRFGFQPFPRPGGCGQPSVCCVDEPQVAPASFTAAAVAAAIEAASPVDGNTPTAQALSTAGSFFAARPPAGAERYVLLSTDGQPSCLVTGVLGQEVIRSGQRLEGPCVDALAAVRGLRALGIKVIVLGIGTDLELGIQGAPSCLEDLARAGGAAREAADGGPSFYSARTPRELELALQRIFGALVQPSCTMAISQEAPDPNNVSLFFDMSEVPFDANRTDGWNWLEGNEGRVLEVYGAPCRRLERLQVAGVEIRYGCAPCETPGSCR